MSKAEDNVVIKNIYYMMAYAFRALEIDDYARLQTEEFDHLADLLAAILAIGLSTQRRRGFEREYRETHEDLLGVRGRIDIRDTARLRMARRLEVACEFDEFTEDTYKNRVLKTCAELLLRDPDVSGERKLDLKRSLLFMGDVGTVDPKRVEWGRLRYHRNNGAYRLLMNVCHMVIEGRLLTTEEGETRLANFLDARRLHALYEAFVLAYYKLKFAGTGTSVSAKVIDRNASDDAPDFLPLLCTDITIERGNQMLIIDTKCYGQILETHHEKQILSPSNLNQIFSYVAHASYGGKEVQGMLLYALTKREDVIDKSWDESGFRLHCKTLDLSRSFDEIKQQLNRIAELME